jgi:hypothetical protein
MEAFDYAMGLVSIVVGIAMSDLAVSFHKLFRHLGRPRAAGNPDLSVPFEYDRGAGVAVSHGHGGTA